MSTTVRRSKVPENILEPFLLCCRNYNFGGQTINLHCQNAVFVFTNEFFSKNQRAFFVNLVFTNFAFHCKILGFLLAQTTNTFNCFMDRTFTELLFQIFKNCSEFFLASITAMLEVSPNKLLTITEGILLLLFLNKFLDQIQNEEFLKAHKASLIDGLHKKTACHLIYTRIKKMNSPNANIYRYCSCVWYFNLAEEEQISLSVNLNTLATITYKETPADLYFFLRFVIFNLLLILFRKII